jgi:hypothetical protein
MLVWAIAVFAAPSTDELPPIGAHATWAQGPGVVLEAGAVSDNVVDLTRAQPVTGRVGVGGLLDVEGGLVGAHASAAPWFEGSAASVSFTGGLSAAFASPQRDTWFGGDVSLATGSASTLVMNAAGSVDLDATTAAGVRFGGAFDLDNGDLEARAQALLGYRFTQRSGFTAAGNLGWEAGDPGDVQNSTVPLDQRVALGLSLVVHTRFGPLIEGWVAPPPAAAAPPPPPVEVHKNPELRCAPGDLPTGRPPPIGLEGWCVRVARNGAVSREGPYVRWHDMVIVAERGAFTEGKRSGMWSRFDHEGKLREEGEFAADLEEGRWVRYRADGSVQDEGAMARGEPVGEWRFYADEGWLQTVGSYVEGQRAGRWVDLDETGREIRERVYADGRLVSTQDLVTDPTESP